MQYNRGAGLLFILYSVSRGAQNVVGLIEIHCLEPPVACRVSFSRTVEASCGVWSAAGVR